MATLLLGPGGPYVKGILINFLVFPGGLYKGGAPNFRPQGPRGKKLGPARPPVPNFFSPGAPGPQIGGPGAPIWAPGENQEFYQNSFHIGPNKKVAIPNLPIFGMSAGIFRVSLTSTGPHHLPLS